MKAKVTNKSLLFYSLLITVLLLNSASNLFAQINHNDNVIINGNLKVNTREIYLGPLRIKANNSAKFKFYSNNDHKAILTLFDGQARQCGSLFGAFDGKSFGLLDGNGQWSYIARKNTFTDFRINAQTKMRIDSSGNIGIGTIAPRERLEVSGNIFASGKLGLGGGLTHQEKLYVAGSALVRDTLKITSGKIDLGNYRIRSENTYEMSFYAPTGTNVARLSLLNSSGVKYGALYGTSTGSFGLVDSSGMWSYLAKSNDYTDFRIGGQTKMRITSSGKVGIGYHIIPEGTKLRVHDATYPSLMISSTISGTRARGDISIATSDNHYYSSVAKAKDFIVRAQHGNLILANKSTTTEGDIIFTTNHNSNADVERMRVKNNGDVVIGKPSFSSDTQFLVNGTIRANEIIVEDSTWSDFVFEEDYNLPSLTEVETHINEKGHLPEVPSAKEVAANGISLGKMQAKLLQKIEELTLYVIEQEKRIKELESVKQ